VVKRMTTTNLAATAQSFGAAAGGSSQRDRAASRSEKASTGTSSTPAAVRVSGQIAVPARPLLQLSEGVSRQRHVHYPQYCRN
jgi:hypothetical protein